MSFDLTSAVELVITSPEPYGAALADRTGCRLTLGALTQLVAQAKERVVISAPYLQKGFGISSGPMAVALRASLKRGINIDIISTKKSLETIDTTKLQKGVSGNLRLFRPSANISNDQQLGSHAKFCVADGIKAYVGSANLTGPGLSKHLEIGLIVSGKIAKQIEELWMYSLEIGLFVKVN